MLGGEREFGKLLDQAKNHNMKIIVDCLGRISSSRPHRKYLKTLLYTLDSDGKRALCYGADGRSVNYEDTAILNYRKLASWNLLIEDVKKFVLKHKVNGIHLDNAQVWPQILDIDDEELYRKDPDNVNAYTPKQILDGVVVRQIENEGYWSSTNLEKYANPIFIKLCRELWANIPDFLIIGECLGGNMLENRQGILARSGVIPRLFKLPVALASIFGKRLMKDGKISPCHPQAVTALKLWYESNRKFVPEGAYLIQSSSSHSWPYPALLYGRGAWSAVDVLFLMPDIPMTFMGEVQGHAYRRNIASVYQAKPVPKQALSRAKSQLHIALEEQDQAEIEQQEEQKKQLQLQLQKVTPNKPQAEEPKKIEKVRSVTSLSALSSGAEAKKKDEEVAKQIGAQSGFDLKEIHLHYESRRRLRRDKAVLRYGKLVPLEARHSEGTHSHVLAFARFSHAQTAIIAINFTDRDVSFFVDMSGLIPYFTKEYHMNTVVLFTDLMVENEKDYYFINELVNEKIPFNLRPFNTICKAIVICKDDPYAYAIAMNRSAVRLNTKILKKQDCSTTQLFIQIKNVVSKYSSLNDFAMMLGIIARLYAVPNKLKMFNLFLNVKDFTKDPVFGSQFIGYCKKLLKYKPKIPESLKISAIEVADELVTSNKLGPVVFVAPELGRWSTVGGLGVMVDELTIGLAGLGEDIYVISPYYNKNRKGEVGYLAKDPAGFTYKNNVIVKAAGATYELGVHVGKVSGVNLVFLHHEQLFPSPYPEGTAATVLRQIVVFCKASLEFLCAEKLIPSIVVTNDWFTGLVAAYHKAGAFGDTFKNTTFFHIFHNLQEAYEGRIFPGPGEGTMDWIHQLPTWMVVDPYWAVHIINPSRCATLCSDQWATVSPSYLQEILSTSPLSSILKAHSKVYYFEYFFSLLHFQMVFLIKARLKKLHEQAGPDHLTAKRKLQQKYFKFEDIDDSIPVFAFVGRIVAQKGVNLDM